MLHRVALVQTVCMDESSKVSRVDVISLAGSKDPQRSGVGVIALIKRRRSLVAFQPHIVHPHHYHITSQLNNVNIYISHISAAQANHGDD